jgi:hypothetical protein
MFKKYLSDKKQPIETRTNHFDILVLIEAFCHFGTLSFCHFVILAFLHFLHFLHFGIFGIFGILAFWHFSILAFWHFWHFDILNATKKKNEATKTL